jgi:hypothetical protein
LRYLQIYFITPALITFLNSNVKDFPHPSQTFCFSNTIKGFILKGTLWRRFSSQSQNSTAAYRLGADVGEGSGWAV